MDTLAVANEATNHYESYSMGEPVTATTVLSLLTDEVPFAGPFTLIEERDVYLPQDESFEAETLYPDREVIVYDSYGPHGIHRVGTGYHSTAEIKDWIDENLESENPGEYAIGQVRTPQSFSLVHNPEGLGTEVAD